MIFTINTGQNTETTSYQLTGDLLSTEFVNLLERLKDNESREINPPELRDSILSTWSSTIFKVTRPSDSNVPYIGIDTLNPSDRDLKGRKILLGKRYIGSNHIISDDLLSSDYDIILSNTKLDNQQQITTKIGILSGTSPSKLNVPFIQSQIISGTTSVSFDFISNGDIKFNSGDFTINDFKTPDSSSPFNNKIITWNSIEDSMVFDNLTSQIDGELGATGSTLDIFGDPININGYDINFSDDRMSTVEIGDINLGESFTNSSISDVLKRMIYQYLPPSSSLTITSHPNGYVEVGTIPNVTLEFTIFKKSLPTQTTTLLNMTPGSYPPISSSNYSTVTSTATGLVTSPINTTGVDFSITVTDGTQSNVSSKNIRGVYPFYFGFNSTGILNSAGLLNFTKLVEDKNDKSVIIQPNSGFYFFIYDSSYGNLTEILDENENNIINSVDSYTATLSSPNGLWVNKLFNVYRISNLTVNSALIYKFNY